ncbi:hypothetical protein N658DRAFT_316461 [Parathielavia hyrcaniae]|uniref:Uncharacterized protein n=1 Tax=Parathielavia hyrcaniae TaxID=113614 RepID=A0AAN6SXT8_9PEZI|nr:hypothetical protein N658DRAFT_316461 [Parathielavia hyrcaniae]
MQAEKVMRYGGDVWWCRRKRWQTGASGLGRKVWKPKVGPPQHPLRPTCRLQGVMPSPILPLLKYKQIRGVEAHSFSHSQGSQTRDETRKKIVKENRQILPQIRSFPMIPAMLVPPTCPGNWHSVQATGTG